MSKRGRPRKYAWKRCAEGRPHKAAARRETMLERRARVALEQTRQAGGG